MRAEFSVAVIDRAHSESHSLVDAVRASGYQDASFYPSLEAAVSAARKNPPHLVLLDYDHYSDVAETFLMDLQATSPEIMVILLSAPRQSMEALQMIGRGLAYDSITHPIASTLEVIQKLDRAAERLFFQFETEQIKERLPTANHLSDFLNQIGASRELDQTIQIFMESMSRHQGDAPLLYFKYVPSHVSLVVTQAVGLPLEKLRGVGVDLKKEATSRLPDLLNHPAKLDSLKELMAQVFHLEHFSSFAHHLDGETLGVFVIMNGPSQSMGLWDNPLLLNFKQIFDITYKLNQTLKEKHGLDILDSQTGLLNRKNLALKISEEVSRSRRILLPVSLITVDLDGFKNLNDKIGFRQADSVLKMVAMIIKKTARVSDIVARTGPDEIVIVLPHTSYKGAAIKAERVRRMIETTRFPILESLTADSNGDQLTVSCGVSEYPSFCGDADGLLRSADEALAQVKRAGGNKVCLATVASGFQMDFKPLEVPAAAGRSRREDAL